ncbi:MAG TPA: hypothetical protein VK446_12315, partial [Methylocystis sp.]|nr:hypothetical protein [Methylocystis sp.]
AANTLASTVFSAGGGSNVRVSVVPYVAAVNPGLTSLSYVDTTAQSPYNGIWMRYAWIAYGGCKVGGAPYWGPPSSGGGGGSSGPGGSSTGDAGDARDILDILEPIRHMAQELLGVRSAHASSTGVTPNTVPPIVTTTQGGLKVPSGFIFVPDGSGYSTGECEWLSNPATVSHYDLFPRTLNTAGQAVAWKGCVEARPTAAELTTLNSWWGSSYATSTDWDVTDTPPGSDPNSLFVPYFWPDEPDYNMVTWNYMAPSLYASGSGGFHNNYINDGYYASGSTTEALSPAWGNGWTLSGWWGAGQFILKYDGTTNSAAWNETGPTTAGPNAGCPEPLTPLTNNQQTVTNAINAMNYWYNGGTIISEGFMWAWRTLSPNSPYFPTANTGMAYGSGSNKVIVLMTDGVNGLADNGDSNSSGTSSANISDYSAYGYLGGYRLGSVDNISQYGPVSNPTNPPTDLTTYFDNRLLAACTNAKAKGITVYTVLFSANISASLATHSQSILQQCASTPSNAYSAANATALNAAFATIATNAVAAPLHLANYTGSP